MAKHDPINAVAARIDDLNAKLLVRDRLPAYAANCAEIRKEIARLESLLPND